MMGPEASGSGFFTQPTYRRLPPYVIFHAGGDQTVIRAVSEDRPHRPKLITLLASGCVAAVVLSTIAYQRKRSWDTLNGMDGYCVRLRVIGGNAPGGFAQLTSVPASAVHKVPEG